MAKDQDKKIPEEAINLFENIIKASVNDNIKVKKNIKTESKANKK